MPEHKAKIPYKKPALSISNLELKADQAAGGGATQMGAQSGSGSQSQVQQQQGQMRMAQ